MNTDEYRAYLRTERWRSRRDWALRQRGHHCEACGSAHALHVHHRSYDRLGDELLEDLRVLCDHCHALVHDTQHARQISLSNATDLVTATACRLPSDAPPLLGEILPTIFGQIEIKLENHTNKDH